MIFLRPIESLRLSDPRIAENYSCHHHNTVPARPVLAASISVRRITHYRSRLHTVSVPVAPEFFYAQSNHSTYPIQELQKNHSRHHHQARLQSAWEKYTPSFKITTIFFSLFFQPEQYFSLTTNQSEQCFGLFFQRSERAIWWSTSNHTGAYDGSFKNLMTFQSTNGRTRSDTTNLRHGFVKTQNNMYIGKNTACRKKNPCWQSGV